MKAIRTTQVGFWKIWIWRVKHTQRLFPKSRVKEVNWYDIYWEPCKDFSTRLYIKKKKTQVHFILFHSSLNWKRVSVCSILIKTQTQNLLPHEPFCSIVYQRLWMFVQFYTWYQTSFQGVKLLKVQCKTRQIKQKRSHHWLSHLNLL